MEDFKVDKQKLVNIVYTNWKGETSTRKIIPINVEWSSSEWHPEHQWVLKSWDVDKKDYRSFAMKDIHYWQPNKLES